MPILRSLLLLVVLFTPALGYDGSSTASRAKDAAEALQLHLDKLAKSSERPDYAKPPAADLFRQIFDLEQLAALPPVQAGDAPWVLDWFEAAKESYKRIMTFGAKPGPGVDQEAILRNVREYEDQYAIAVTFLLRLGAREGTTVVLFMDQLAPEQRTSIREAGLQRARHGGAELVESALGAVAVGLRPANARLITAAMRDTRDVWATFLLPDDRSRLITLLAKAPDKVKDDEAGINLAAFAARLSAEQGDAK